MLYDPSPFAPPNKDLQALELPVRAYNALRAWRPDITLAELHAISDDELLRVPGMGRRSVRDIRESVEAIEAITGEDRAAKKRLHEWVDAHRTLVLALMRGEAVIVPLSAMKVTKLELPR
jgi:hypothetical protein